MQETSRMRACEALRVFLHYHEEKTSDLKGSGGMYRPPILYTSKVTKAFW